MADREKVIKGLECCLANGHNNCPYKSTDEGIDKVTTCTTYLMQDALSLLKEQEAVKPTRKVNENGQILSCGNCGAWLIVQKQKYCHECGRKVKWDAAD